MLILKILLLLRYSITKGHLGRLEEMHSRKDLPGANTSRLNDSAGNNQNKHHGRQPPGAGLKSGGNHSSFGKPDSTTHGGPKGGVFGPNGRASDKAVAEMVAADRASNPLPLGSLKDEVNAALGDAEKAGNQDIGNPLTDKAGGAPPSPLAAANEAGENAALDAALSGASPEEAAAAGQNAAASTPKTPTTPEEAAAAQAAQDAANTPTTPTPEEVAAAQAAEDAANAGAS
ncbi:hypothetical protein H311_02904, partial [Anncaliia algerae PRA109]